MSAEVVLKSSAQKDKEVLAAQIAFGEIALNYYETGPFLQCKDRTGQIWRIGGVIIDENAPVAPGKAAWWYKPSLGKLSLYTATGWKEISRTIITDSDIDPSADIAVSKLAHGLARQLLQTNSNGTDTEWTSNVDIPGTLDVTQAATFDSNVVIAGNLTVNGTTTTIDTTTLLVEDKNIELGVVATPSDLTANGGGITLKGTTDKTINWIDATDSWTSSENFDLASGKSYRINNVQVLTATALGSTVQISGANIPDGTIVNSDISETAEIAVNKLADGSARQLLQTDAAGTGVEWTSNVDIPGTLDVTGIATFDNHVAVTGNLTKGGNTVVTVGDIGTVTSTMIVDGTIVDGDVNVSAAIAGTKINPDFGSQNIVTTGNLTVDTNTLFVDATNNKVGIGTTSPGVNLDIASASNAIVRATTTDATGASIAGIQLDQNGSGASSLIVRAGSNYTILSATTSTPLLFGTNNTERARIDSSGRLGIGTSSPSQKLSIGNGSMFIQNSSGAAVSDLGITFALDANTQGRIYSPSGKSFAIQAGTAGSLTDALTVDQSGRVGIGTTSPSSLLDLSAGYHSITWNNDDWRLRFRRTDGTFTGGIKHNGFGDMSFWTSDNERARIDSSGRLLVGTSSSIWGGNVESMRTTGLQYVGGRFSADNFPAEITLLKSRGASVGTNTIIQNNDVLGNINFLGADGTTYLTAVQISAQVDGTPGTNDIPSRLIFSTTADGASSPTERMRIASNGVITIQDGAVAVIGTLTDGATITPDLAANCNFTVTLGGSRTIANPTNITAGQSGSIFLVQDATGSRTVSWGSYWDFPGGTAPTLSTAANAVDRVDYIVRSATSIHTVFTGNYS